MMDDERGGFWDGTSAKELAMLVAVMAVLVSLYAFSAWR
jgi:hypothetical protein